MCLGVGEERARESVISSHCDRSYFIGKAWLDLGHFRVNFLPHIPIVVGDVNWERKSMYLAQR